MTKVKTGIIGVGFIGEEHLKALRAHESVEVIGIADQSTDLAAARSRQYGIPFYTNPIALMEEARPDYVTICTPHFSHTSFAIEAMRRGIHALVEKPLTVSASAADECLRVMRETGMKLGVGYLQRLRTAHQKFFDLVQSGFVGRIQRVTMVRTAWFRSMAYYRSNPWRGTWKGEGGGILVNQAPHDLDLLVWTAGLPSEVLVEMGTLGHDIEVEDDVCAVLKWANGATGTLHVSTNEAPGRSFYEIAGTKGTLRLEDGCVMATALAVDSHEFSETTEERMAPPPTGGEMLFRQPPEPFEFSTLSGMHANFAAALREGAPLVCSAEEALQEVELANAMLISGVMRRWIQVPIDRAEYDRALEDLMAIRSLEAYKAKRAGH